MTLFGGGLMRDETRSAHRFYRDLSSHPVWLSQYDTYRVVETFVTIEPGPEGEIYVFHYRIEDAPSSVRLG